MAAVGGGNEKARYSCKVCAFSLFGLYHGSISFRVFCRDFVCIFVFAVFCLFFPLPVVC